MDSQSTSSVVAAAAAVSATGVSIVAAFFTARAANAAKAQTDLQREVAEAAAQPYLWADIRSDDVQGFILHVVVGNSGPTVAQNVRVVFDPPLRTGKNVQFDRAPSQRLADGIASLAPGRHLIWPIGSGPELLAENELIRYSITITGDGPHGPIPENRYEINLADFREAADVPSGSLYQLTKAVKGLTKKG